MKLLKVFIFRLPGYFFPLVIVLLSIFFPAPSSATGGADPGPSGSPGDPIPMMASINLAGCGWTDLLVQIQREDKYVALDLSACTMDGTEFDPGANYGIGKKFIVSLGTVK